MKNIGKMTLDTRNDREIVMTRVFDAPRQLVFDAYTKPELVSRWLTGPPGWEMPECEIDLRVGGSYRYKWRNVNGNEMGMSGVFREIVPPERLVATEKFDQPWYPGEVLDITVFAESAGKTTISLTIQCDSKETFDAILKSNMESGVEFGFNRLDTLLQEKLAGAQR
jgi:uncharacterized protein YndB with AHSA1/START domain